MPDYIVVLSTTDTQELANTIAGELIRTGIAACVNIIPNVTSIYKWKGEISHDGECLMLIKSRAEHFERLRERIRSLHTYDVPEVIALSVLQGDSNYLKWLYETTATAPDPSGAHRPPSESAS